MAARTVGWHTEAFCEIDPFCRRVLNKHWPDVPIHEDIKELDGTQYKGSIGIVTGGFPCQPFSTAARGRNNAEDLWPEMARIIRQIRPLWVLAENVPGNEFKHIERACADLALCGYKVWPIDMAVETRRHNRRRFWIVAHANSDGEPNGPLDAEASVMQEASGQHREPYTEALGVADVLPEGMDKRKRLKALGNSINPRVAEVIFRAIERVQTGLKQNG